MSEPDGNLAEAAQLAAGSVQVGSRVLSKTIKESLMFEDDYAKERQRAYLPCHECGHNTEGTTMDIYDRFAASDDTTHITRDSGSRDPEDPPAWWSEVLTAEQLVWATALHEQPVHDPRPHIDDVFQLVDGAVDTAAALRGLANAGIVDVAESGDTNGGPGWEIWITEARP